MSVSVKEPYARVSIATAVSKGGVSRSTSQTWRKMGNSRKQLGGQRLCYSVFYFSLSYKLLEWKRMENYLCANVRNFDTCHRIAMEKGRQELGPINNRDYCGVI